MRRVLFALPLVLVVAACGSKQHALTVTAVPQPAPLPAKAAAACKAAQLRPDTLGHSSADRFQSAAGTMIGTVGLRNIAAAPCSLDSVTVRLEPALVLQTAPPAPKVIGGRTAAAWLGSLRGRRAAGVSVQWANWCVKGKRPAHMRLVLPGDGGSLTIPAPAGTPRCYAISAPTTVSATLAPALGRRPVNGTPATSVDLGAEIVPAGGKDATMSTRPGGGLNYLVKLTNTGGKPVPAAPAACPLFAQQVAGGVPVVETLPCSALEGLKPGRSVVFEMWLTVPPTTQPGPHTLEWMLDPYATQTPSDTAPVTITTG